MESDDGLRRNMTYPIHGDPWELIDRWLVDADRIFVMQGGKRK